LLNSAENNNKVQIEKSITEENIRTFLDNYLRRNEKTEEEEPKEVRGEDL